MSHTFVIANRGRQALMITEVKPDCACTATAYDKTIPPGGQGTMALAIKTVFGPRQLCQKKNGDPERSGP